MKNKPFQICNETIYPGENLSLALPQPELVSIAPLYMPINVIHGKIAGPCLLLTAATHGDELNGTAIIKHLIALNKVKRLRGTIIAVPVMNIYGLINRNDSAPGGFDLENSFPGKENGSYVEQVTHSFTKHLFSQANVIVDLHTGKVNFASLPHIQVDFSEQPALNLAHAFNAPIISHKYFPTGTLGYVAKQKNIPYLRYEAGEAMRFTDRAIKVGFRGIIKLMQELDMLDKTTTFSKKRATLASYTTEKTLWLRATTSGIAKMHCHLGKKINKEDVVCEIEDPFGAKESVKIISSDDAIIINMNHTPLLREGEALLQLAVIEKKPPITNSVPNVATDQSTEQNHG